LYVSTIKLTGADLKEKSHGDGFKYVLLTGWDYDWAKCRICFGMTNLVAWPREWRRESWAAAQKVSVIVVKGEQADELCCLAVPWLQWLQWKKWVHLKKIERVSSSYS
jgi:hypothetical protein